MLFVNFSGIRCVTHFEDPVKTSLPLRTEKMFELGPLPEPSRMFGCLRPADFMRDVVPSWCFADGFLDLGGAAKSTCPLL